MWPRFDLTHGELARLCRKAGKPEYVNHIRSHYDNVRKQLFQKLDWFTRKVPRQRHGERSKYRLAETSWRERGRDAGVLSHPTLSKSPK